MPQYANAPVIPPGKSEMSQDDLQLLSYLLRKYTPKKVVELGVAAGGTTTYILDELNKSSTLHSCDINKLYYRDTSQNTGYVAVEYYNRKRHPEWKQYFGEDISLCISKIGNNIDFVIMDTVHSLPGEFLNFLVIFPFLDDNSVIMLHDFGRHVYHIQKIWENMEYVLEHKTVRESYCALLLYGALQSHEKIMSSAQIPNSCAVVIDKTLVLENLFPVFAMLFLPWSYMPNSGILTRVTGIISDCYPRSLRNSASQFDYSDLFKKAVAYNRALLRKKI